MKRLLISTALTLMIAPVAGCDEIDAPTDATSATDAVATDSVDDTEAPDTSEPDVSDTADADDVEMDTVETDSTETDSNTEDGTEMDGSDDPDTEDDAETMDVEPTDATSDIGPEIEPWVISSHPCAGNRTDTLFCTDADTCYTGCGTTTSGRGVYVTTDGGATWDAVATTPPDVLAGARVNDISQSADGKLYIAGEITGDARVVSLDDDGNLGEVWNRGTTVDFSFTAGSFVRAESGLAVAESLTGNGIVYRRADSEDPLDSWDTGYPFWRDGDDDDVPTGVQILQLAEFNGTIYASGSVINQPPTVFVSDITDTEFDFSIIQLDATGLGAFNGELWDIDVNADGIVAGGVNQARGVGIVYTHPNDGSSDVTDPTTWQRFDVSSVFPDNATWVQGVCAGDGVIYAVGRESREEWGFVLRSDDGGETFENVSYYDGVSSDPAMSDMYECQVVDGDLYVAGAGGFFGIYAPN